MDKCNNCDKEGRWGITLRMVSKIREEPRILWCDECIAKFESPLIQRKIQAINEAFDKAIKATLKEIGVGSPQRYYQITCFDFEKKKRINVYDNLVFSEHLACERVKVLTDHQAQLKLYLMDFRSDFRMEPVIDISTKFKQ